jgi:hypothetical protein
VISRAIASDETPGGGRSTSRCVRPSIAPIRTRADRRGSAGGGSSSRASAADRHAGALGDAVGRAGSVAVTLAMVHGERYATYAAEVGRFLPAVGRRRRDGDASCRGRALAASI